MREKKVEDVTLSRAAISFLSQLSAEERKGMQQEVNRFVGWYGKECPISRLVPLEIANYAEWVTATVGGDGARLAPVRAFLIYAKKEGLVNTSLASHLGVRKGTRKPKVSSLAKEEVGITPEALDRLKAELTALIEERPTLAEEIRRAAADKDFRENAPLEAAREKHEQVEARIRDLESLLSTVVVQDTPKDVKKVRLGCTVVLGDLASGEELSYTLVSPNQIDPSNGRISVLSPVGSALLDRKNGDDIEVLTPSGKLNYRIQRIELASSIY